MYNLAEAAKKMAELQQASVNQGLEQYIRESVRTIEGRGEKLEDYTLTQIMNPIEFVDSGVRVTQSWRLVKNSSLQNLPTYEEDTK